MKTHLNPPRALAALAVPLLFGAVAGSSYGQTTLLDWSHSWNYMHPTTGVLPAGSGTTEPNSGATKWYAAEEAFASYTGPSFTTSGTGFEAGAGAGPLGYGALDYTTTPLPAPGEFAALGTTFTTTPPATGRYTSYFRTTFTVPDDGNFYVNPVIRYIMDDGGFIYLDGELVLRVNMASTALDNFTTLAANTTNTESHIRNAALSFVSGSVTGRNDAVTPAIVGNATVIKRITSLTPGVHTLAVSVHNQAVGSSDLNLAAQLVATPTSCAIAGSFSNVTRNDGGTPDVATDDTVSFTVNVIPTGVVSPSGWTITNAGSAASSVTGAYNTDVTIANIPIAEFSAGTLDLVIADADTAACTTTVSVIPQRIIASDDTASTNLPLFTTGTIPNAGWVFDDALRSMTMQNGGGGGRITVRSQVFSLATLPAIRFTGALDVVDTSSGTEPADSFVAYLIVDGNTANPVNLITAYDVQVVDGVLSDDELAALAGTSTKNFDYIIPETANSVQIVIEGINDSANEKFLVRDLKFSLPPPTLQTIAGAVTFNNNGTAIASDDTISAPVTINAINLGASTGWTSDSTPASGLYSAAQPVTFGPFPAATPVNVVFTDTGDTNIMSSVLLAAPPTTLTVSAPANIQRVENGPGVADDTVTFDLTIAGANGGPGWSTLTSGVSPSSGAFGTVTFTVAAPLPASPFVVNIDDVSYPSITQTASVALPGRYVIGQRDLGAGIASLASAIGSVPSALWVNDGTARTLTINTGVNAQTETVLSEILNLTSVGDVNFSAKLVANDASAGSNYDLPDKFKIELIIDGGLATETIENLVTPYDVGDGLSAVPFVNGEAVANGLPDGWINGYTGTISAVDGFDTAIAEYDAHKVRDEFNRNGQGAAESAVAELTFSHAIPASASSVQLRITSQSISGSETSILRDVLFTTSSAPVDSDNDGMSDDYENANGLNPASNGDKLTDLDGDGQSNFAEFLAGTVPNNPASTLKITDITPNGVDNYNVTISTVAGKTYQLQESTALRGWQDLPGGSFTASSTTTVVPVPTAGGGPVHFLRARVVP